MKTRIIGAILAVLLAVAGGFALYLYARSADARATANAEFVDAYVVAKDVPIGTPGETIDDFVTVSRVSKSAMPEDAVEALDDLNGLVATTELLTGDILREGRFADPQDAAAGTVAVPEGMQEVTVTLPVARAVGGEVKPGDYVGLVYSSNTASRANNEQLALTQFAFHRVLVTKVTPGRTIQTSNEDTTTQVDAFMVTFAATTPQVEKIVYGAEQQEDGFGGIWLTLEPETATQTGSTQRSGENIFQ
ncbi:Flp pilus assembly protein CpaB [Agromyces endophyticus]|uniref:Flp pilus assembly protein CpaB n=1 Tax=Agromyces sp. H17E-10 TaxID=2932244 RepID=UPI001FD128CC|nr:Flp pilus assembly protein CpaB [Agromyces sp. H17E-10]UOQ90594.1 Flp pilus assembly protein CpaB [Agromyces sp. H17E-10]